MLMPSNSVCGACEEEDDSMAVGDARISPCSGADASPSTTQETDGGSDVGGPLVGGCDDDAVMAEDVDNLMFELHTKVIAYETEIRTLRSQLDGQRHTVAMMEQAVMMMTAQPCGPAPPAGRHRDDDMAAASGCPLIDAAVAGDAGILALLLDGCSTAADGQPNAAPTRRPTQSDLDAALLAACRYGRHGAVDVLLNRGANVHADIDSPLLWACYRGDAALAKTLLMRGATPTVLSNCPLRLAIKAGCRDVVEILIQHGASPV